MQPEGVLSDARVRVGALVGVCFLLGSTGWLAWLYQIASLAEPSMVDFYTMVLGYLSQAAGIGVYMVVRRNAGKKIVSGSVAASLLLYVLFLDPATMSDSLVPTLAFGYVMNVACGYFQGHYLTCLAELVASNGRGIAFGGGYAASTLATWLLSGIDGGSLTTGASNLVVCVLLALIAGACLYSVSSLDGEFEVATVADDSALRALVVLAGATVVVASLVKNAGFSFPTADLSGEVDLELSRLFYGAGLVVAGIVADRDRRYVTMCCAASLAMPFLMLALSGAGASSVALWALGYLLFGFFSVWRVILFADLAGRSGRAWIAGASLLLGRLGDVAGTALLLALGESAVALVTVSAVLFAVASFLLFRLYERMYSPASGYEATGEEGFNPLVEFCDEHGLSKREQDVLYFLLEGMANAEIARELSISEATAKFHVRNILKKTGCAGRNDVAKLYNKSLKGR
ncbi:MAG: helix-turn-helix transcriptional regulator [Eggerthellaceae bacterium]|nr:helix-turn-helix transcriptional regulator [Eggerthellaceae bacterium]